MGGGDRLTEFLQWIATTGVEPAALVEFRRVALELFEQAKGGRVTETHILHLIDQVGDLPNGRESSAIIEEVGEALLRFQASRPAASSAPPVPAVVPVTRQAASQPFVARPEDRVARDLMPPAVPRHTPPDQPVVSFTEPSPSKKARPRPVPTTRRSGLQFRCVHCQLMVTATEELTCPRCGQRAPQVSNVQAPVTKLGAGSRIWPVAIGVIIVAAGIGIAASFFWRVRDRSEPAGGDFVSSHLGVRLHLPLGWRHERDGDRAPTTTPAGLQPIIRDAIALRTSSFFSGGMRLHLVVAARPSQVTDAVLAEWVEGSAHAPEAVAAGARELAGLEDLRLASCVPVAGARPELRCAGESGGRRAFTYVFATRSVTVVAVVLSSETVEAARADADDLISGLDIS